MAHQARINAEWEEFLADPLGVTARGYREEEAALMAHHDHEWDSLRLNMQAVDLVAKAQFTVGDKVYSRANPDDRGFVTGIQIRETGLVYLVTWADHSECLHSGYELSAGPVYPEGGG